MSQTRDITLRWEDPNVIEKGHKVYRSKEPMDINNMPDAIASLVKNSTVYIDKDQTIGDTNYYRVSAWIDGHEVYSNEVKIEIRQHRVHDICTITDSGKIYILSKDTGDVISEINTGMIPKCINQDHHGNILVGYTNGGYRKYDVNTLNILKDGNIGNTSVWSIAEMINGDLLVGGENGNIYRYNQDGSSSTINPQGDEVFGISTHKTENFYYVTTRNNGAGIECFNNDNNRVFFRSFSSFAENSQACDTTLDGRVIHTTSGQGIHSHNSPSGTRNWGINPSFIRDSHSLKVRNSDGYALTNSSQVNGGSPRLVLLNVDGGVVLNTALNVEPSYYKVAIDNDGKLYNVFGDTVIKRDDEGTIIWEKSISGVSMISAYQFIDLLN